MSYYLHHVDKVSQSLLHMKLMCLTSCSIINPLNVFHQLAGTDKSAFPLPEPQDVFLAAQVKFDDLGRDLRQLGRDLTSMCHCGSFSLMITMFFSHPSRFVIIAVVAFPKNIPPSALSKETVSI